MASTRLIAVAACLACALTAPAAHAQDGGGLYTPFPEPVAQDRAQRYYEQLGVKARPQDLDEGRVVSPRGRERTGRPVAVVASRRAGVGSVSNAWLLAPLLGALALTAAVAVAGRRAR